MYALIRLVSPINDTWLVDSSSSKHLIGYKDSLSCLVQKESPDKVMLGVDYQYPIKRMGEASYKLDSRKLMKMKDVLYVPVLKKNLLSIWALDTKGFIVSFVDGKVLMWKKGKNIDDVVVIGVEEGRLYILKGHVYSTLMTSTIRPCDQGCDRYTISFCE